MEFHKKHKILGGTAVIALVVCLFLVPAALANGGFDDVPTEHMFYDEIMWLVDHQITSGCSVTPPLYCPDAPVSRGQMAVFMYRLAGNGTYGPIVDAYTLDGQEASSFVSTSGDVITGDLTINGDLTLTGLGHGISHPATTRYLTLHHSAFTIHAPLGFFRYDHFLEGSTPSDDLKFYAPIQLPHNAHIVSISARIYDASSIEDIDISLEYADVGGKHTVTSVASSGSGGATTLSASAGDHVVDAQNHAYYAKLQWVVPPSSWDIGFQWLMVEYTVETPLP